MTGRQTVRTDNPTATSCLLCRSLNSEEAALLKSSDICRLYRKHFGIDVSALLSAETTYLRKCRDCGLIFFDPPETGSPEFYDQIQRNESYYMETKQEYLVALSHIRDGDRILEVGAGTGNFAKLLKNTAYTGLELSSKAVEASKDRRILLQNIKDHAEANPGSYDAVCLFQVLEHIAAPREFLEDCIRCLKNNGKLIIALPSHDSYMRNLINFPLDMPPHHVTRWTDAVLRDLGRLLPLQLLELNHEPVPPYQVRFIRRSDIIARIYDALGRPEPIIDFSIFKKSTTIIAEMLSLAGLPRNITSIGAHVTAVYRKG